MGKYLDDFLLDEPPASRVERLPFDGEDAADRWQFDDLPADEEYRENIRRGMDERRAYALAQDRWHRQHGAKMPAGRCAGCCEPLRDGDNLHSLPDGARVHATGHECLIAYGRKWRGAARAALSSAGIQPPEGWSDVGDGDTTR